jgi:hypothetical protein
MRLVFAMCLGWSAACAQTCVPERILPAGAVSGTLDSTSCALTDGSLFAPWRLDLPQRGRIAMDLSAGAGASLILRDSTGARLASGASIHQPLEAGSYTLLVDSAGPAAWSLLTAFSPEASMLCVAFPRAGLNQTAAGALGSSGCAAPDGTPYEGYLLTTMGAGTLTVTVASTDFTPSLTLRDSDGYAIASGASPISAVVDAVNSYEIVVATADQTGAYQLTTSFQPADSETCRPRMTFSAAVTDTASITANSCSALTAGGNALAWYNYYSFTVGTAGLADLSATSTDFGATLYLLDDGGNILAVDSGGGAAPGQSEIRMQLTPGNYTAQVFSSVPSGGAYSFAYQFAAGTPQPCTTAAANSSGVMAGTLSPSGCRTLLGLADLYTLTLPASGTLTVTLSATGFTGQVAILDAQENLVISQQDLEGLGVSQVTADLAAGAYTIAAASAGGAGTYQLTVGLSQNAVAPCAYVQALSLNGGYIQKLGPASCRAANGQPVDLYTFTIPSDSVVAAIMTSGTVDGLLTLTDSAGNFLRSDHDSYSAGDPLIAQFLAAGTYQVAAGAEGSSTGGYYEVDLRTVPGVRPPFCASRGQLAAGGSIPGNLTIASCQYSDSTFADLYQVSLAADTTVALTLNSGDFDACLVLLDAKGNMVAEDDDSGGNTTALIDQLVPAGTYYVVAKSLSGYAIGGYTLSLAQSQ